MINQLKACENKIDKIIGKGYKDLAIINSAVDRIYNTTAIQKVITDNVGINVYSTWGKGPSLKEWKKETRKLGELITLLSPSLAARVPNGAIKIDYILDDWSSKIRHNN